MALTAGRRHWNCPTGPARLDASHRSHGYVALGTARPARRGCAADPTNPERLLGGGSSPDLAAQGFEPCRGRIEIVDKLFSRIGASDHLAAGRSAPLVEMLDKIGHHHPT